MTADPIVDEIKRYRDQRAAKFNYDLRAIVDDARRRQGAEGRQVVSRPPRIPQPALANNRSVS